MYFLSIIYNLFYEKNLISFKLNKIFKIFMSYKIKEAH